MKQLLLLTILFFTITTFQFCSQGGATVKEDHYSPIVNIRDTALLTIEFASPLSGLNGEYGKTTARRVFDTGTVIGRIDTLWGKDKKEFTLSQKQSFGVDTVYWYMVMAFKHPKSNAITLDSISGSVRGLFPVRIDKSIITYRGEILKVFPYKGKDSIINMQDTTNRYDTLKPIK